MKSKLAKIIRMEFKLTTANKAYIALTILGPFLIAAVTVLPTLLATRGGLGGSALTIAIAGGPPGYVESVQPGFQLSGMKAIAAEGSTESLDALALGGAFDGYIVLPQDINSATHIEYVSKSVSDPRVTAVISAVIGQSIVARRLVAAGLSPTAIAELTKPPTVETRKLSKTGEKESQDFITVLMSGLVLTMLLYMTVLMYGQVIGRSVLTEKTSKTVEIMLSSVRPMDLLFGKVLGKAVASLLQYGVWISMSWIFLRFVGPRLGVSVNIQLSFSTLGFLVLFFLLAFFLYSSVYAALGASATDEQHLGQLAWPVIIFLIFPVVMISPIIMSPHAPFVVAMSLFPLTAPIVMFLRIVVEGVPGLEIALAVALLVATIVGVIALSAKIFRVGLLMTGKRFKLAEIVRWIRY